MIRIAFLTVCLALSMICSAVERIDSCNFEFADTVRTYTVFIPDSLPDNAPVVVYLHGYGSKTRMRGDLNAAASRHGFAVCCPDGAPDAKGKDGWKVGYPSQSVMPDNEEAFLRALLDDVCSKYNLSRENVFCAGMSNGGDLIHQIAYTDPQMFKAYASVAGLSFSHIYLNKKLSQPMALIEIHGTADKTSMWNGDPDNTGGWGAYIAVPLAVSAIANNNHCQSVWTEEMEMKPGSKLTATRHIFTDSPSGHDVELIEMHGGSHSWFAKDIDTGEIVVSFFSRYLDN